MAKDDLENLSLFHCRLTRELVNLKYGSIKIRTVVDQREKPQSRTTILKRQRQQLIGLMVCINFKI